ncbi:MAG: hypothetical protein Q9192_000727 [Flavoplaca navasiana]
MAKPDLPSIVTNWGFEDPDLKDRFARYGYVVHRLEASLWAFFTTSSLEQGALKVVNLGDDADTVGAVCGGLNEALYDGGTIPQEWLDGLQAQNVLNNVVEVLLPLCSELDTSLR